MTSLSYIPNAVGDGFAVLVNANAKRGGRRIAIQLGRALPGARVRRTKSVDEVVAWIKQMDLSRLRCLFAAGGDGTALGLVNALDRVIPKEDPFPTIGLLPLGTGNAWARTVGARKLGLAIKWLVEHSRDGTELPTRCFGLLECEGGLTSFAGSGWDAQIINDYREQLKASKGPSRAVAKSVYGYLSAVLLRTAPKSVLHGRAHVIIENLGDDVYVPTPDGGVVRLTGMGRGAVIYDGPASVAGCATIPEFGYGFRAYPFAERFLGRMNVRVYDESAATAVLKIPALWRGAQLPGMYDWFVTACRMTYSRPVAFQTAGDAIGMRRSMEYRLSERTVRVLNWRALP